MSDDNISKKIGKADDDAKVLIMELLEDVDTFGIDIDSIFNHKDKGYMVIEFLKCVTVRPHKSHPNRYWNRCWRKVFVLFNITKQLNGTFYWITYEDSREQFSVIKILEIDKEKGITKYERKDWNYNQFKKWYRLINSKPKGIDTN
tara:strand:- start:8074 stop:8511 length:438 start_codon:yes stop_codon:yes gene_type:complete